MTLIIANVIKIICWIAILYVITRRFKQIERILELQDMMQTMQQMEIDLLDADITGDMVKKQRVKRKFQKYCEDNSLLNETNNLNTNENANEKEINNG